MNVKIVYNWAKAQASSFNRDAVRKQGIPYRAARNRCLLCKTVEVNDVKQWLADNEIIDYAMFGVYTITDRSVYFKGLAFDFKSEDHVMFFKLRFF